MRMVVPNDHEASARNEKAAQAYRKVKDWNSFQLFAPNCCISKPAQAKSDIPAFYSRLDGNPHAVRRRRLGCYRHLSVITDRLGRTYLPNVVFGHGGTYQGSRRNR